MIGGVHHSLTRSIKRENGNVTRTSIVAEEGIE